MLLFLRFTGMIGCGDEYGVARPGLAQYICLSIIHMVIVTVSTIIHFQWGGNQQMLAARPGGWFIQGQKNCRVVHRVTLIPTGGGWGWVGPG